MPATRTKLQYRAPLCNSRASWALRAEVRTLNLAERKLKTCLRMAVRRYNRYVKYPTGSHVCLFEGHGATGKECTLTRFKP